MQNDASIDALLPPAKAAKAEMIGVKKANMDSARVFAVSVTRHYPQYVGTLGQVTNLPYGFFERYWG